MEMNKYTRNVVYGFLIWLIPFIVAILFINEKGELSIDVFLFKTIMIVVGSITGAILLTSYFKKIDNDFLKEAIIVGTVWFAISIILDFLVLIPMSGMGTGEYFIQIGLRYLTIPIMAIMVGKILATKIL